MLASVVTYFAWIPLASLVWRQSPGLNQRLRDRPGLTANLNPFQTR